MDQLPLLHVVSILLHVLFFAAWFGMGVRLSVQARGVATAEPVVGAALAADGSRTVLFMGVFVALGYLFALGAFFANGGFTSYNWPYHSAIGLGLVLVVVHWAIVWPAWRRLRARVGTPEANGARQLVAVGMGLGSVVWLVIFVLMYWNRLDAAMGLL